MTLKDYVLTYKDVEGNLVVNIADYYEKVVWNLEPKYKDYSLKYRRTVICPVHDDSDPSFGLMPNKHGDTELYHCFGCNSTGNIIDLHRKIVARYDNKKLSEEDALYELALIFQINLEDDVLTELEEEPNFEDTYRSEMYRIDKAKQQYSLKDFSNDVIRMRKKSQHISLTDLNASYIKLVATEKGLIK